MATAIFTDANIDFDSANSTPFSVNWQAVAAGWTPSMNGASGIVPNDTGGPFPNAQAIGIAGIPHDSGSVPPVIVMTNVLIEFDYVVTNVCVGMATRITAFGDQSGNPTQGTGTTSAHFSENQDPTTYFGGTDRASLFSGGASLQWAYFLEPIANSTSNGITLSNYTVTVTYGTPSPTVTDVSPARGDAAGGNVVTLTGTDLDTGTNAFFNGTAATDYQASSSTSATCITPVHAVGPVTVTVV